MGKEAYTKSNEVFNNLADNLNKRAESWAAAGGSQIPKDQIKNDVNIILHQIDIFRLAKNNENNLLNNNLEAKKKYYQNYLENGNNVLLQKIRNKKIVDTSTRDIQIERYNLYKYRETLHLLYVLIFVFLLASIIVLANINDLINNYILLLLLVIIFIFYLLYVIKIILVDNVNINNFIYKKFDYNKPTEEDIRLSYIKDQLTSVQINPHRLNKNSCTDPNIQEVELKENKLEKEIKEDANREQNTCLEQ